MIGSGGSGRGSTRSQLKQLTFRPTATPHRVLTVVRHGPSHTEPGERVVTMLGEVEGPHV